MDRKVFFREVRDTVFHGRLTQEQVVGITSLLDACAKYLVSDEHHIANILAQVHHETGAYMLPIKETVYASHRNKNPSDAEVIRRLDNAFRKGQLPWVKHPYWRDGFFGRGQIQLTHRHNYKKAGDRIGENLVGHPERMLLPTTSAAVTVLGMTEGMFTGKKLSDYSFPAALDAPPSRNPRRIVNGRDGTDAKIAAVHRKFWSALVKSGVPVPSEPKPDIEADVTPEVTEGHIEPNVLPRPDVGGPPVDSEPKRSFWYYVGRLLQLLWRK